MLFGSWSQATVPGLWRLSRKRPFVAQPLGCRGALVVAGRLRQIAKLQKKLKDMGGFAHDRELVECPKCGLQEDVTGDGLLITCRPDTPGRDTGRRLVALDKREEWWRCPACGAEFRGEGLAE